MHCHISRRTPAGSYWLKLVTGNRELGGGQALYAVKFVQRGELVDEAIKKEVINHCMLMHDNIARFREVILCPRHLAIVMEFAQGGDLFNAVQQSNGHKMNEPMARYFFQQLIAGLGYMHCQVNVNVFDAGRLTGSFLPFGDLSREAPRPSCVRRTVHRRGPP
jgi:serine/threonine protein kinase